MTIEEKYFRRCKRKYYPVEYGFDCWPCNGVWMSRKTSHQCIMPMTVDVKIISPQSCSHIKKSTDWIYTKAGSRYRRIGLAWPGFPSSGIWLVIDALNLMALKLADMPYPMPLAAIKLYESVAAQAMRNYFDIYCLASYKVDGRRKVSWQTPSIQNMVDAFMKAVAKAEGERMESEF